MPISGDTDTLTGCSPTMGCRRMPRAVEAAGAASRSASCTSRSTAARTQREVGNLVTDHLLRELSKRLRATLRPCDHAGRITRDEFVVILRRVERTLATLASSRACV